MKMNILMNYVFFVVGSIFCAEQLDGMDMINPDIKASINAVDGKGVKSTDIGALNQHSSATAIETTEYNIKNKYTTKTIPLSISATEYISGGGGSSRAPPKSSSEVIRTWGKVVQELNISIENEIEKNDAFKRKQSAMKSNIEDLENMINNSSQNDYFKTQELEARRDQAEVELTLLSIFRTHRMQQYRVAWDEILEDMRHLTKRDSSPSPEMKAARENYKSHKNNLDKINLLLEQAIEYFQPSSSGAVFLKKYRDNTFASISRLKNRDVRSFSKKEFLTSKLSELELKLAALPHSSEMAMEIIMYEADLETLSIQAAWRDIDVGAKFYENYFSE